MGFLNINLIHVNDRPTFIVSVGAGLLVAFFCFTNPVMYISKIRPSLDLNCDQFAKAAGDHFFPYN